LGAILNRAVPNADEHFVSPRENPTPPDPSSAIEPQAPVLLVSWRKSTIPFRQDQYKEIGRLLSELHIQHDVQLTIAEVIRLGLDNMIDALKSEERDTILIELHKQQQRESEGNENLKHSKSQGLGRYLAARDLLSR
jgi:hypothetical protein